MEIGTLVNMIVEATQLKKEHIGLLLVHVVKQPMFRDLPGERNMFLKQVRVFLYV